MQSGGGGALRFFALVSLVLLLKFSVALSSLAAEPLLLAAAADLAPLQKDLERLSPVPIRLTLGSSGMLARQIRSGAPFDVYLAANEEFVADLARTGEVVRDTVTPYATGRLGLWSKKGWTRLEQLDSPQVRHISIANPAHAPYGAAAEEVLRRVRLLDRLRPKLVLGENVRQAFEFARTGNADATITSWTLVHGRGAVLIPSDLHGPIRQAGAVVAASRRQPEARRFLAFLRSDAGRRLLAAHGLFP